MLSCQRSLIRPLENCEFTLNRLNSGRYLFCYRVRSPTADIPTTSAFLGGMVAQEAIKMITKQYVPVNGYCVVDLVETWTMVVA